MNFYKVHQIPNLVKREVNKINRRNPTHTLKKNSYDRVGCLDVMALHAKANAKKTGTEWQGGDKEDRTAFIAQQKKGLGLNLEKALAFSSRRSTHQAQVLHDMPFLEFNSHFKPIHIQSLFQPHEMQWSAEEFMKQGQMMSDLSTVRLREMFNKRVAAVQESLREGHEQKMEGKAIKEAEDRDEEDLTEYEKTQRMVKEKTLERADKLFKQGVTSKKDGSRIF